MIERADANIGCVGIYTPQVTVLAQLESPFVMHLVKTFRDARKYYMLTEPLLGGELFTHLSDCVTFTEARTRFYISSVLLALQHMHGQVCCLPFSAASRVASPEMLSPHCAPRPRRRDCPPAGCLLLAPPLRGAPLAHWRESRPTRGRCAAAAGR